MKKIGLALGSGGAKGLSHIAFLQALDELGVRPSIIAGTSIGAVIGGFYAAGVSGLELEQLVKDLGLLDLSKLVLDFSLLSNSAIYKGKGVEEFLSRQISAQTFEEVEIPLRVVATDFWKRKEVIFTRGNLVTAIRASMAMPALFEPVQLSGMVLIDGGAVNPLPYDIIQEECDLTIAIDVSGEKTYAPGDPVPNMVESILSTFQIMQASIVEAKKRLSPPSIYVKPALTNIRVLDFYRYKEILAGVREEVQAFKDKLRKVL
ncbi:MAG: patatin-like phospholipase family protein [Deltaproteobacteria bacterium]|nr:MAG: patatin-like phospholipase family protein [Deltaproteobacteria bacterium]